MKTIFLFIALLQSTYGVKFISHFNVDNVKALISLADTTTLGEKSQASYRWKWLFKRRYDSCGNLGTVLPFSASNRGVLLLTMSKFYRFYEPIVIVVDRLFGLVGW